MSSDEVFIPHGPEGGYGGAPFRLEPPDVDYRVKRIVVRSGDMVDNIKIEWKKEDNTWDSNAGGYGGGESVLELDDDERITEVRIGCDNYVYSIGIVTNKRTFNAGGGNRSRSYTFTVQNGEAFMGFIGRSGEVIDALGIITAITDEKHTHKKVSGIAQDLRQLINDEQTSDIKIVADCGTYYGHRVLLAARSPTFFDQLMVQRQNEIQLDIDDNRVLDCFLQYLYTDVVEAAEEDIIASLLVLADKYQVPRLKVACGAYSMEKFNDDNWLAIFKFAVQYNEEELQEQVVKYVGGRIREDMIDYSTFYDMNEELFSAMIESDEFPLDELTVFKLVNDWCEQRTKKGDVEISNVQGEIPSEKVFDARKLMKLVRLPLLDVSTLRRKVKPNKYVDLLDYVEAIEFSALPGDFDEEFTNRHKRFRARKSICKFKWTNPYANITAVTYSLEDHDKSVTKTSNSGWDLVLLGTAEFRNGTTYYEIEIVTVNNDKSGLVLGVTGDKNIGAGSFASCHGLGMTGTPYNVNGGGYNTHAYNNGDVFGTLVDFAKDDIKFYRNGQYVGSSTSKPSVLKKVIPCVFLYYQNDKVKLLDRPRNSISSLKN